MTVLLEPGSAGTRGQASRWARLLAAGRPEPGRPRLLRPRSRARARRARRRRDGEVPAARDALSQPSDGLLAPLPGVDVAAAGSRTASRACTQARHPASRQPERRRLPGLGGERHRGVQPTASEDPLARPSTSSTRASSASARPTSGSDRRPGRGRSSTTPSTSTTSRRRSRSPEGGPVLLLGGDQYQAYRLELGLQTLAALLAAHPDAQLLVTGRLVAPIEPIVDRLGPRRPGPRARALRASRCARDLPASARPAAHEGQRPLPEPRDRGDGVRATGRLSRGAAACRSWSATTGGIGVPHPDGFERDEPPPTGRTGGRGDVVSSPGYRATPPPHANERSSGSPSSPGSNVTRSCSSASRRDSRACARGASRGGTCFAAGPGGARTGRHRRGVGRAFGRRRAADSRACAGGSRRSPRRVRRCARRPHERRARRRATGRTRSCAPLRTARTR